MDILTLKCIHSYFKEQNITNSQKKGCNSNQLCYKKYMQSLVMATKFLDKNVRQKEIFNSIVKTLNSNLIQFKRLKNISYNIFAFNDGEFLFPHTHGMTIFLPYSWFNDLYNTHSKISTLFHEIIHIYQRLYPAETNYLLLKIWSFNLSKLNTYQNTRQNPDINKIIYDDILPIYNDTIVGSSVITNNTDHPYEFMAYYLTDVIINNKQINSDEGIKYWIKLFL